MPRWAATLFALVGAWLFAYELHTVIDQAFGAHSIFDKRVHLGVLLCASGLVLARAITRRGERVAWLLIGAGVLAWSLGEVYYTLALWNLPNIPIPSAADGGYLAFPVLAFAGVCLLARHRVRGAAATLWADGLAAALAVGAASAAFVLDEVVRHASGRTLEVITNLAYPVTDLVLLGACVAVIALRGWRIDRTWGLLGAGIVVFWVADSLYLIETALGTYTPGGVFDEGWWLGLTLIALAAWQPAGRPTPSAAESQRAWMIAIPVGFGGLAAGILGYGCLRSHPLNAGAVGLALAALGAVAVRLVITYQLSLGLLERVRAESLTDPLTGLPNRRALANALGAESAAGDGDAVLALYDLDGFKGYNDTFGHSAGDALLARLGHSLLTAIGDDGSCYRLGGDEFCVVMPGQLGAVHRLLDAASRALSEDGDGFSVTSTWGAASVPDEATTLEAALRIADERMYACKTSGLPQRIRRQPRRELGRDTHPGDLTVPRAMAAKKRVSR
ncbi:MAG TPA: GGDEF domain-containing protein [Solirubrobacteraceae bacterium]|nr:GGDEF domain-containing protein [Solirubrobacteraceae bacterium]